MHNVICNSIWNNIIKHILLPEFLVVIITLYFITSSFLIIGHKMAQNIKEDLPPTKHFCVLCNTSTVPYILALLLH